MKLEDVKHIKIDHRYTFRLKDGRELKKHGNWLLGTSKDGHWCVDPRKLELIEDITDDDAEKPSSTFCKGRIVNGKLKIEEL